MKKYLTITALLLFSVSNSYSQDGFKTAIDDFHYVLAFTYHPMDDENNYEPVRRKIGELESKAENLEKALEEAKITESRLKAAVEQLAEQCEALKEVIEKDATDEVIHSRMSAIHEKFHDIETLWEKTPK